MGDFFAFRRMLAPVLIHIVFWFGFIGCMVAGVAVLTGQTEPATALERAGLSSETVGHIKEVGDSFKIVVGLGLMIFGPLLLRLYCELFMLPFRYNDTLTDIRNSLINQEEDRVARGMPRR
jgi:hypothetical protein